MRNKVLANRKLEVVDIENLRNRIEGFYGKMPDILTDCAESRELPGVGWCLIVPAKIIIWSGLDESFVKWQIRIGSTIAQKYGVIFEPVSIKSTSGGSREMCFIFPFNGPDEAMAQAGVIAEVLLTFQISLNWTRRWIKRSEPGFLDDKRVEVGLEAVGLSLSAHECA